MSLALGIVVGAFFSWLFTYLYYRKSSAEQRHDLAQMADQLKPRNTLDDFEKLLEEGVWEEAQIDNKDVWVCRADNTFQIHFGDCSEAYAERWTTVYPDPTGRACPVYLKIGGVTIKELTFVYMDGFRIFVPMTGVRPTTGAPGAIEFFWNTGSLEVKVCRIVGHYYIYESLEGIAKMSNIAIIS
ncbi:MAG: hypothetical protein IPG61_02585 [bacterium]|nr:hypothetical protein [bacterium]